MFIALTCVATMFLQIPVPGMANGYVNLGDAILLIGAFFLGPVYGAVAAGVGAALADILLSFATYAPATLIIKALMAVVFWLIAVAPMKKQPVLGVKIVFVAVGALASEAIMVLGYFVRGRGGIAYRKYRAGSLRARDRGSARQHSFVE